MSSIPDTRQIEDPQAMLERQFIEQFIQEHGEDPVAIMHREDLAAADLRRDACKFAAGKLAEVSCRSHFVNELHAAK